MQHLKACQNEKEINLIAKQYHCFILLCFYVLEEEDFRRTSHSKIYLQQSLFLCVNFWPFFPFKFAPNILSLHGVWHCKAVKSKGGHNRGRRDFFFFLFFFKRKRSAGLVSAGYCYQKLSLLKTAYRECRCTFINSCCVARTAPREGKLCGRDGKPCKKVLENHWHEREHFIWK